MSETLNHFLITRFNIPYLEWSKDRFGNTTCDEKWLNHRFELFEKYCFPSVVEQTNQNFKWLVFFDKNIDLIYKNRIEKYKNRYKVFEPCYVNSISEFYNELFVKIDKYISKNAKYIITSRIDNDDIISKYFVEKIHEYEYVGNNVVLNYKYGYIYDSINNIIFSVSHESNQFITLIENCESNKCRTVMSFNHRDASSNAFVVQLKNIRGWMVVVHAHNLSNSTSGRPTVKFKKLFSEFNIDHIDPRCLYNLYNFLKYILRKIIKRNYNAIIT